MEKDDTICAISTPPGEGGIGIVRLSGAESVRIVSTFFRPASDSKLEKIPSHYLTFGRIVDHDGNAVDETLVSVMRAPHSYTCEDIVEVNCHGGMVPLRLTLQLALDAGARLAEPGEFTKRAFLNGRLDLAQAEAVVDIIRSRTEAGLRSALSQLEGGLSARIGSIRQELLHALARVEANVDFPDEDLPEIDLGRVAKKVRGCCQELKELREGGEKGRLLQEGASVAIVGRPNVGKSSLFNALLRESRAIVTEIPGTTRDVLEQSINLNGIPTRLYDSAGIRESDDKIEAIGVDASRRLIEKADVLLMVLDASEKLTEEDRGLLNSDSATLDRSIWVLNKCDLASVTNRKTLEMDSESLILEISALTGAGLKELESAVYTKLVGESGVSWESAIMTRARHLESISAAIQALDRLETAFADGMSPEFLAADLNEVIGCLGEILGLEPSDELLDVIFSEFCIGK